MDFAPAGKRFCCQIKRTKFSVHTPSLLRAVRQLHAREKAREMFRRFPKAAYIPVTRPGALWQLGHHRLLCGDARGADDLARLMGGAQAAMAFLDPPYNVRVRDIIPVFMP